MKAINIQVRMSLYSVGKEPIQICCVSHVTAVTFSKNREPCLFASNEFQQTTLVGVLRFCSEIPVFYGCFEKEMSKGCQKAVFHHCWLLHTCI